MNLFNDLKARKALIMQSKGQNDEAEKIYKELIKKNYMSARYLLAYSVMLIKKCEFENAKKVILLAEKSPDVTEDNKRQIYINYAICLFKMGEQEKAIKLLEKEHKNHTSGLLQETLGYFYVENGNFDKAYDFLTESIDYDDTDPIVLDNMAQYYYRKPEPDIIKAKEYFEKAINIRPNQIDTLYFLSLYDIEDGKLDEARKKLNLALEGNFSPLNFAQKDKINELLQSIDS